MSVTAKFLQDPIEAAPGVLTTCSLRLHNNGDSDRTITLEPSGSLAEHVRLEPMNVSVARNQIVDVAVSLDVPATVTPGCHPLEARLSPGSDAGSTEVEADTSASTTVNVAATTAFSVELYPSRSRSAMAGRHRIRVANEGNVDVVIETTVAHDDPDIDIALATPAFTVLAGTSGETALTVTPTDTYWSGPTTTHDFVVHTSASDGRTEELPGHFEQRPRLPNWLGPAAAGAFTALALGAIAWFAVLAPWVEDTADDAAADALEHDRAALQMRIDALDAAAADAKELPLGSPTDMRLSVAPTGGTTESASEVVDPGMRLSATDVIFQNPTGAVGTVSLMRDDEILLSSELANFRDFDLHLVAPFTFENPAEIVLEVDCRTPGAGESDCPVSVSIAGFADEVD